MAAPQSYKSHAAFDPITHFTLAPLFFLNIVFAIYVTIREWPGEPQIDRELHISWIVLALCFFVLNVKTRLYALKLQDRLIRLEERLRLIALLPPAAHARIPELTVKQLIALRFASDPEIPALVRRVLKEGLDPDAIKSNIVNWRADNDRV